MALNNPASEKYLQNVSAFWQLARYKLELQQGDSLSYQRFAMGLTSLAGTNAQTQQIHLWIKMKRKQKLSPKTIEDFVLTWNTLLKPLTPITVTGVQDLLERKDTPTGKNPEELTAMELEAYDTWLDKWIQEYQSDPGTRPVFDQPDLIQMAQACDNPVEAAEVIRILIPKLLAVANNAPSIHKVPKENLKQWQMLFNFEQTFRNPDLSESEFAQKMGLPVATLLQIKNGEIPLDLKDLEGTVILSHLSKHVANQSGEYGDWKLLAKLAGIKIPNGAGASEQVPV